MHGAAFRVEAATVPVDDEAFVVEGAAFSVRGVASSTRDDRSNGAAVAPLMG
jgi:hypothetical protein